MSENKTVEQAINEDSLGDNVKQIIGGVVTIVAIVVPVILIRKLIRTLEESDTFKTVEKHLQ